MNKLLSVFIAIAMVMTVSSAFAFNPTTTGADIVLHHGGASASSSTFFDNVRSLCVSNADVFVDSSENTPNPGNALDQANTFDGNYWVVACEVDPSTVSGLAGTRKMLYYKRDEGGSGVGVSPLAAQIDVAFMAVNIANCPSVNSGSVNFHVCDYASDGSSASELAPLEVGSSDVEPQIFAAPLNNPTGIDFNNDGTPDSNPVADLSQLTPESAGYLTFGTVVNLRMYQGLQSDQFPASSACNPSNAGYAANGESEACMPSLTTTAVTSLMATSRRVDSVEEIAPSASTAGLTDSVVHICRRVQGSGTQAQHNRHYYNYPCEPNQDGDFDVSTPQGPGFGNFFTLNEGSADLARCLLSYNDGTNEGAKNPNPSLRTRWAIGLQSLTRTDTITRKFRYVKIDGVAPTIDNVHAGRYSQWYGQSFQRTSGLTGDQNAVLDEIVAQQNDPAALADFNVTHAFGIGGWVAVPNATNVPAATLNHNNPIGRFERTTNNGTPNSCAKPRAYGANGVPIEVR